MKQKHFCLNLWNPDWQLVREDNTGKGRLYRAQNGKSFPSVTTVLDWNKKDSLIAWRKKVGEEQANLISTTAARRGTKLHAVCEAYIQNQTIDPGELDILTLDLFKSIQPIIDNRLNDVFGIELQMYSEHLGVAGTADCIAKFDGKNAIVDFKTSSKPKKEEWIDNYFMQTACYAVMFEERTGICVPNLVVLIAVESSLPQLFIQKRDKWIDKAKETINEYYINKMGYAQFI
jgi:genome maintenance exonuclease 1